MAADGDREESGGGGRFGLRDLGRWANRIGVIAAEGVHIVRDTRITFFQGTPEDVDNQPEMDRVRPLLPPGERLRYVAKTGMYVESAYQANKQLRDDVLRMADPWALFGLLNILNPVAWVEAVVTPFRMVAELAALPAVATAAAVRTADGRVVRQPLPPEQEAFRVMFGLSADEPLADQLAAIAHRYRYSCAGGLDTPAGSLLLLSLRSKRIKLALSDTRLYAVEMADRDDEQPDSLPPTVFWSVERRRIARVDSQYGPKRAVLFPMVMVFDDGSWLRFVAGDPRQPDHRQFLDAIRDIPGDRPDL